MPWYLSDENYEESTDYFLDTSKNVSSYKVKCINHLCNSKSYKTRYNYCDIFVERELCLDCGYGTSVGTINLGQIEERIFGLKEINCIRVLNNLKIIEDVPLFAVAQYMSFQDVIEYFDGHTLWKKENDGYIYGYEYVGEVA